MTKQEIISHYDKLASNRDLWIKKNAYYHQNIKKLYQFLIPPQSTILEIGCGTGDLLNSLSPAYGLGIDISSKMIEVAKTKYPHLTFQIQDAEKLNLTEHFDFIIISDTVGDLTDVWQVFRKLRTACHRETKLIISYYNCLWEPILKLGEKLHLKMPQNYQNWLSLEDLENLLKINGFEVVKKGQKQILPIKLPIISNFINRYFSELPIIRNFCLTEYLVGNFQEETASPKSPTVSVIIPARNEAGNIENAVQRTPHLGGKTEIIFIEGNSQDNTWEEIKRVARKYTDKNIKYYKQDGRGKGDAVRKGFKNANCDILMILDADLTVPPEDLEKFYLAIAEGKGEFINGCRLVYPMEKQAMRFLNLIANKLFGLMFSWLLGQRIKDTLCGTKVLTRENYQKIAKNRAYFGDFDPFGDFDLLFGASKLNLKIVDMPIRYKERVYGTTQISRFKHGWLLLKMCVFAMRKIKFIK